jgi:hypothetical protein
VLSGGGSFATTTATSGSDLYTAPSSGTTATINVYDSANNNVQATVTITGSSNGCAGTYNMDLAGTSATMVIGPNSTSGAFVGYISVPSYGTASIQGSCTNGSISFTNLYSGSPYTGTYFANSANPNQIFMSGTFTDQGSTYSWFASTQ